MDHELLRVLADAIKADAPHIIDRVLAQLPLPVPPATAARLLVALQQQQKST